MSAALLLHPSATPAEARVSLPGSKSITNRALVAAALAAGRSELTGALVADDTLAMRDVLADLGVAIDAGDDPGCVAKTYPDYFAALAAATGVRSSATRSARSSPR